MVAQYYCITDYEAGIQNTGSRSSSYHCACEIFDEFKIRIPDHDLNDVFYGKWRKCSSVISKWRKNCERAKLSPLPKS